MTSIKQSIENHFKLKFLFNEELINSVEIAAKSVLNALKNDNKILWCGNGGSASQANHLSAELLGGMYKNKIKPFNSYCLNVDTSFITAWSNDNSFDNIFVRQLEALGKKGDILIGLSTSGNSKNIVNAAKYAQENEFDVISLTGNDGGALKIHSNININIPTDSTQNIQEIHILIGHIICDFVEQHYIS